MKKFVLLMLISGQIGVVNADVVTEVGDAKYIFNDGDKDSLKAKIPQIAELDGRRDEVLKRREQLKDELGLGELERMTVSSPDPGYDDVKMYRGANTDQLFSLLDEREFAAYWLAIAKTIGMVADEAAAKRLANFASSAFPLGDGAALRHHLAAREGAIWGLTLVAPDQPVPWVREYLIAHADADQWLENFGGVEIDREMAHKLAKITLKAISRMGNEESLAMLKEVRARHSSQSTVAPFSKGASAEVKDEELDFIDMMVGQTQMIAEARAKHAK